jgi:hypothetical protein
MGLIYNKITEQMFFCVISNWASQTQVIDHPKPSIYPYRLVSSLIIFYAKGPINSVEQR